LYRYTEEKARVAAERAVLKVGAVQLLHAVVDP
jgi:hypothetical protein